MGNVCVGYLACNIQHKALQCIRPLNCLCDVLLQEVNPFDALAFQMTQ
jgi:hypothetical protein